MYSQNDEERVILANTPEKGRLLDVGAYDGKTFSNTLALIEKGWGGVLIECSPGPLSGLLTLHKGNDKLTIIGAPLAVEHGKELLMYDSTGDALSSSDPAHVAKWSGYVKFAPYYTTTVGIGFIATLGNTLYDFINVDIEGQSCQMARSLYQAGFRSPLWCVEMDQGWTDVLACLKGEVIHMTGENVILRCKDLS